MISPRDIQRVTEATDILKLVQSYVKLRRSGKEWFGLCCFHTEQTASMTVNSTKQRFLCRGCEASGDAVGFVMRIERLSFPEAVRLLATRAGVTLDDQPRRQDTAVAAIAAEARWFWETLRYRASCRQAGKVTLRNRAARLLATTDTEDGFWSMMAIYRHYARSAARWDRIITRIDNASRGALLTRYMAYRTRHPQIVTAYQKAQALDYACAGVEARAVNVVGRCDINVLIDAMSQCVSRNQ